MDYINQNLILTIKDNNLKLKVAQCNLTNITQIIQIYLIFNLTLIILIRID